MAQPIIYSPGSTRDAWEVAEKDFPSEGCAEEKLTFLIRYAVLAPSGHNRQPWAFRVNGETVDLLADRSRAMPAIDPEDRELIMSCGAAALHLRLALRHFGLADRFLAFPDAANPDLLARIGLGGSMKPTAEDERMFHAIRKRHTFRHPFLNQPLPDALRCRLEKGDAGSGIWYHLVEREPERRALASLIAEAEQRQLRDPSSRDDLLAWIHPNPQLSTDGVPGYALGSLPRMQSPGPTSVQVYETGKEQSVRDRHLAMTAPALLVLGTTSDRPLNWLYAGQALARILLLSASQDVYVSFLNQPVQIAEMRPRVLEAIDGQGYPQLILRLGYGAAATPTPRRSVADVLVG